MIYLQQYSLEIIIYFINYYFSDLVMDLRNQTDITMDFNLSLIQGGSISQRKTLTFEVQDIFCYANISDFFSHNSSKKHYLGSIND